MKTPFQLLAESGVAVLLVGGHALHVYRYTRQTIDFDFMVAEPEYTRLHDYLRGIGFSEEGRMGQFGRFRPGPSAEPVIDIGTVDPTTFAKLWAAAEAHDWDGAVLRVPALMHLIALKLHASKNPHRSLRDQADIVELLRLNPDRYSAAELEATCLRYGPPGLYERLKNIKPYDHPQP